MNMTTIAASSMHTLARAFEQIQDRVPGAPWVPLGNFSMDFFRNHPEAQAALISDPLIWPEAIPAKDAPVDEQERYRWAVFCAASAQYLARYAQVPCPIWVHNPVYARLAEPWYFAPMAARKAQVRERAERTTPVEFASKNIYCGENVFVDKYAKAQAFVAARSSLLTRSGKAEDVLSYAPGSGR